MNYNLRSIRVMLWMVLCSTVLFAQQKQEVYKILGISVEGQRSGEPAAIIANTGLRVGDELTIPGEQTRTAIERLYKLRLFSDIQIYIENRIQNGVYLLIKVKENPRLERIEVYGNDEFDQEDIEKKIKLVKGQLITPEDLSSVVRILKAEYAKEGYLNAEIRPSLVVVNDTLNRVVLKLDIDEGEVVKIDLIRFHGNKAFSDSDLKGEMKETNERTWWKFWQSNKFDKKKYEEDKELIVKYYQKNGYRDAQILRDSISYDEKKKYMTIDIWVYEGPKYYVRNITWEGNTVYTSEVLSERLGFKKGDVFDKERFEKNLRRNEDENDVTSLYSDNGYLWFQVEPEEIVVEGDSLDIVLHIREHNQFRIGQVVIKGNTKTYEKVIRRELLTKPGDYFSRQRIISSVRQLAQLNYFNPEKITPDVRPVDDKTVDLEYSVEEKSSDTFNMSVGYSGAFGFSGGIGLAFNNFSIWEPFRGGAGQVLTFDWQFGVSNYYRTFSISFTEPWMFDTPTLFGISYFNTAQQYYAYLRYQGISLRFGRRFSWPDMYFRGDWTIRYQKNEYHPLYGTTSYYDYYYREGISTQFGVAQVISRNSTDSPIFPTRGSSLALSSEVYFGPKREDIARFHKHMFSAEWYVPLSSSGRIALMTSTMVAMIFGFEKNAYVPYQDLFYMGGTGLGQISVTPLRGYEDRSIGPYDGEVGGKSMIKHTAELRFALTLHPMPIYTLAFCEAGNVWLDHTVQNPLDLKRSAGLGLRLLINPIGLIGFDYGYGFDSYKRGGSRAGWMFHFQFGKSF
ncbi:MAG: outer membrane protein assembly factor BamA [Bacteroidetes bacterium]|nr:outer membrane protein assembly factor BamA [Bacteroidota bacterium]